MPAAGSIAFHTRECPYMAPTFDSGNWPIATKFRCINLSRSGLWLVDSCSTERTDCTRRVKRNEMSESYILYYRVFRVTFEQVILNLHKRILHH
jgi:hypothetical protein